MVPDAPLPPAASAAPSSSPAPRPPLARLAMLLAALLPALVLLASGLAKWIAPGGTLPRSLSEHVAPATFAAGLQALGVLEVLLAVGLVLPRTRALARYGAFLLLGLLSAFVAWNAGDTAFVRDCGCMGALKPEGPLFGTHVGLLARNAALAFLVAWSAYLDRPRLLRPGAAAGAAAVAAGVLLLGTLYVAERSQVDGLQERLAWHVGGRMNAERLGWGLPDVGVRDARGRAQGLLDVLQPYDTLVFFSTTCPHCERAAPRWSAEAAELARQGRRLLLVVVSEAGGSASEWLARHGAGDVPYVVALDPESLATLGVAGVPFRIVVDADGRVVAHEGYGAPVSLLADLATAAPAWPDGADRLWAALAQRAFGDGARLQGAPRPLPRGAEALVESDAGALGRLRVLGCAQPGARALETAYALDSAGRVVWADVLAAGPFATRLDEVRQALAALRGAFPADGLAALDERLRADPELGSVLAAVREQVARLAALGKQP